MSTTTPTELDFERAPELGGVESPEGSPRKPLTVEDIYNLKAPDNAAELTEPEEASAEEPALTEEDPASIRTGASLDRLETGEVLQFAKKLDLGKTALSAANNGFESAAAASALDADTRQALGTNSSEVMTNTAAIGNFRSAKEADFQSKLFEQRVAHAVQDATDTLSNIGVTPDKSEVESTVRAHVAGETVKENLQGTNNAAGSEVFLTEEGAKAAEDASVVELTAKAVEGGKDVLLSTDSIAKIEQVWRSGHDNNRLKVVADEVTKEPESFVFQSYDKASGQFRQESIIHKDGALALLQLKNGRPAKEVLKGMSNLSPDSKQRYWQVIDSIEERFGTVEKGLEDSHTLMRVARLIEHLYNEYNGHEYRKPSVHDGVMKIER